MKNNDHKHFFNDSAIPFADHKQSAFLGYLFDNNNGLFKHYAVLMSKTWFSDPDHGTIFELISEHYKTYSKVYSHEEIKNSSRLAVKDNETQRRIRAKVDAAIVNRSQYGMQALVDELNDWKNAKILEKTIVESSKLFNAGNFSGSTSLFEEAIRIYNDTTFANTGIVKLADFGSLIESLSGKDSIQFGLPMLDRHLSPENETGGLLAGASTLLIGGSNAGKTTSMITCTVINAIAQNRGLLITLEDSDTQIRTKILRCAMGLLTVKDIQRIFQQDDRGSNFIHGMLRQAGSSPNELMRHLADERYTKVIEKLAHYLDDYIEYMPYNHPGMEVEQLSPLIERRQDAMIDRTGKGFKLLTCDYPAILSTQRASKGRMDLRNILDAVYGHFVQLALRHKWHSLVAMQANRNGAKLNNRTSDEDRLLEMTDAAEGWGPITTASTVITINRPPDAMRSGKTLYKLCKSRQSSVGLIVAATSNYDRFVAYGNTPEYGSISYYGGQDHTRILEDKLMPGVHRELSIQEQLGVFGEADAEKES